jgi:hypothetical protein
MERKKNGSVVNRYISAVEQLPTDAKLAGVLAVGGAIRYKLKDDSHVSHHFLIQIVDAKNPQALFTGAKY